MKSDLVENISRAAVEFFLTAADANISFDEMCLFITYLLVERNFADVCDAGIITTTETSQALTAHLETWLQKKSADYCGRLGREDWAVLERKIKDLL